MSIELIPSENTLLVNEKTPNEDDRKIENFIRSGMSKKSLFSAHRDDSQVAVLSRAVMRQPVSEGRQLLHQIHGQMKLRLAPLSDEALLWLLGGSSQNAQGGFKDVQAFRRFLDQDPAAIQSSRLVNGLETVLTAIGYRLIRAKYSEAPYAPETEEQKKMDAVLQEIKSGYFTPPINAAYVQRMEEGAAQFAPGQFSKTMLADLNGSFVVGLPEEELSDPSDEENKAVKQPKRLQGRVLKTRSRWTRETSKHGVEARAHASGTAPIVLASVLGLCRTDKNNPTEVERTISLAAGVLVIPTFDRGDYHSVAEAYAGIHYYKNALLKGISSDQDPRLSSLTIAPKEALEKGLDLMVRCLDKKHRFAADQVVAEYLQQVDKKIGFEFAEYREPRRNAIAKRSPLYYQALKAIVS